METTQNPHQHHPAIELGEAVIDPVSIANMVSSLVQIILSLVGPDKAKAAIDWEVVNAAQASAEAANVATDAAALAVLHQRGIL